MIKVIVFDFDGVLVDSNAIKHETFFRIFDEGTGISKKLIKEAIPKGTRYDALRHIFMAGNMSGDRDVWVNAHALKYHNIVQSSIVKNGLFEGVREKLEGLKAEGKILFINSATPREALLHTVEALGITNLFEGIYGAPESKIENLKAIMKHTETTHEEILFVGDGTSDEEAAESVGCSFVGIANEWNGWHNKSFPLMYTIKELK